MESMRASRGELGSTLRAWRERLSPTAAGLPFGYGRRARGLRREEVADLAGISVDYLVRLEQGRSAAPSSQVVASLARALQLTPTEREHLYRLAQLMPPTDGQIHDEVPLGLQRLLTRLTDTAVAVFAADWQLIWWNAAWAALLGDPSTVPPRLRNFARDTFPVDDGGPRLAQWPVTSRNGETVEVAVVSDLRRAIGRFPQDARLRTLIDTLNTSSPRFAELWASGVVGTHREDHKVVEHPTVGPIAVDCDVVIEGDGELKIVALSAAPDSEDETKLRLATVSGVPEPVTPR
jgi:transcriptional regulator with XRE-family HTH domain